MIVALGVRQQPQRLDVTKLLRLIDELNDNVARSSAYAAHALLWAILDHVPPVLGCAVLGFTPPAASIPPAEPVSGPVLGLSAGTAVVRVGPKGLSVHLEATTTGASYTRVGSANAAGDYGAGLLAIASSSYGPDRAGLVLPGTMVLYVVAGQGKPVMIHMSGLPVMLPALARR